MPKRLFNCALLALLTVSAAANVALWRGGSAGSEVAPEAQPAGAVQPAMGEAPRAARADDAGKLALLRSLEDEHLRAARGIADEYWSAGAGYESSYATALRDGLEAVREALERRYGEGAKDDVAFRTVFRPLDPMHWYLSSDQQLAIQSLKLERDLALQEAARNTGDAATPAIMQRYQSGLAALLDAGTLLEFELRDSPIAAELRSSGIELSEREFRETCALMARLGGSGPGGGRTEPASVLATREALRDLLGPGRFVALWAARDPFFAELGQIVERHSLPESTALGIYEVMGEFQDRRIRLAEIAARDPERAARDSMALTEEERAAIARLTGAEIAEEIVRGRALQSFRRFGGSGPPPLAAIAPRN
jgi:hypothetical protein